MELKQRDNDLPDNVINEIKDAKDILENPGFFIKKANWIGKPVEFGMGKLPIRAQRIVEKAVSKSLEKALKMSIGTMNTSKKYKKPSNWLHRGLVMSTGAASGAFSLTFLAIELPISTGIMLRSIADQARSQGHNLQDIATRLECLNVFALGGNSKSDDMTKTSYYAIRAALAKVTARASEYLAGKVGTEVFTSKIEKATMQALAKLIAAIAAKYGSTVAEKAAAMIVPGIGALGGAAINTIFINHFQRMAKGHFVIKRLEAEYGEQRIRQAYNTTC